MGEVTEAEVKNARRALSACAKTLNQALYRMPPDELPEPFRTLRNRYDNAQTYLNTLEKCRSQT